MYRIHATVDEGRDAIADVSGSGMTIAAVDKAGGIAASLAK